MTLKIKHLYFHITLLLFIRDSSKLIFRNIDWFGCIATFVCFWMMQQTQDSQSRNTIIYQHTFTYKFSQLKSFKGYCPFKCNIYVLTSIIQTNLIETVMLLLLMNALCPPVTVQDLEAAGWKGNNFHCLLYEQKWMMQMINLVIY